MKEDTEKETSIKVPWLLHCISALAPHHISLEPDMSSAQKYQLPADVNAFPDIFWRPLTSLLVIN